ncbi:hypothetical protein DFS33DRAFT_1388230 [Desarmillaria ectypa]|nr:hypothetical protein DFS33DRAFT_1388230 [Desarmillaria ectypa]
MLRGHMVEYWTVAWKWSSLLVEEIVAKEPLAAFEAQGWPREFGVLKVPGFLSTLVKLWFHALRHGGEPAALRDMAFSLILFDSVNFSTVDGSKEVIDQVDDVIKDTPDAATICGTHIFNVIQCSTVNMRLLDGPLAFAAYTRNFMLVVFRLSLLLSWCT